MHMQVMPLHDYTKYALALHDYTKYALALFSLNNVQLPVYATVMFMYRSVQSAV